MKHEPQEFAKVLYGRVKDDEDLQGLERRLHQERLKFFAHAGIWMLASALMGLFAVSAMIRNGSFASEAWTFLAIFGWGVGVSVHGTRNLLVAPRTLAQHRELVALRGSGALASLPEEIRALAESVRTRLGTLQPRRPELEAAVEAAEQEARKLAEALNDLEGASRGSTLRHASRDRRSELRQEQERARLCLERIRVTLSNLEVDTLLLSTLSRSPGAAEALSTEAELLRAAVEGARAARSSMGSA